MARHHVILECDWFVLGRKRLIKQLAFYDVVNHMNLFNVFRFELPAIPCLLWQPMCAFAPHSVEQKRFLPSFRRHCSHSHHSLPLPRPGRGLLGQGTGKGQHSVQSRHRSSQPGRSWMPSIRGAIVNSKDDIEQGTSFRGLVPIRGGGRHQCKPGWTPLCLLTILLYRQLQLRVLTLIFSSYF